MRYLNGSALLNHHFIRLIFLDGWRNVVPPDEADRVFTVLEDKLNQHASQTGELRLTIPFVCIDCRKGS